VLKEFNILCDLLICIVVFMFAISYVAISKGMHGKTLLQQNCPFLDHVLINFQKLVYLILVMWVRLQVPRMVRGSK